MRNDNYLCLLLLVVPLCFVVDAKKSWRQRDIDAVWTRRLFARQKNSTSMETRSPKCKSEVPAPVRRCSLPRGSCSSSQPCCGPCSFCRCRFFNAICRCWKIKPPCLRRRKVPCTSFKSTSCSHVAHSKKNEKRSDKAP